MRAYERFLNYATIWTSSDRESRTSPSALRQFDLAHQLAFELNAMGLTDVGVDNHCFVYGRLPASPGCGEKPRIGFIAHLDTYPDCPGKNVKPQLHPHYNGQDLPLGDSGLWLRNAEYPHLAALKGQTLITSDGTTLLGVDDKAGIAEILTALELISSQDIPHGQVSVAFIPDEELGSGTVHFDLERFGAQYAYTVDGWEVGEIVCETFNAVQAVVTLRGAATHTGRAKGVMVNAQLLAMELAAMLPAQEIPALTEGREGFFHLLRSHGTVEQAELVYTLRDFTAEGMARRVALLRQAADTLNARCGPGTATLALTEQYRNMKEKLDTCPQLIEKAETACRRAGVTPIIATARGGTDGARLSYAGLPCPNLGIGGSGYHSPKEHITAEAMDRVARILQELVAEFAR